MKKAFFVIFFVLLLFLFGFSGCKKGNAGSSNSELVVSFLEAETGKQLAEPLTVKKNNEEIPVAPDDYAKIITGYTFLCASPDDQPSVSVGRHLELKLYYVQSEKIAADRAMLIVRCFSADTGDEILPPILYSQKNALSFSPQSGAPSLSGYVYLMADPAQLVTVSPGKRMEEDLYYAHSQGSAKTISAVMIHHLDQATGEPVARASVYASQDSLTVKKEQYRKTISGYDWKSASKDEVTVSPGNTGELIYYYGRQASSASSVATVTVSYCEAGTEKTLLPDQVVTQKGSNLFLEAASWVKQIDGYTYASASAANVTAFPGENISLKLYYAPIAADRVAKVVINYCRQGTTTQIAQSEELTAVNTPLGVTLKDHIKAISGYTYVSSDPSGVVTAELDQTLVVNMYYKEKTVSSGPTTTKPSSGGTVQAAPAALYPSAPGTQVAQTEKGYVDYSNASEGYLMARFTGDSSKRSKIQITKDGTTYTYDLSSSGNMEVFPLTMGSGDYTVKIFEQVSGSSYSTGLSAVVSASLRNSLVPFLYPSQTVNYSASSAAVAKSNALCAGASNDLERLKAVYSFVTKNISYDFAKANSVSSTYVPDVDQTLASGTGICYDYAALMAAMLRCQGIPTRLIKGYVAPNGAYHAWNEVYLKNAGWITVAIYVDANGFKLLDSTFAASQSDAQIASFISNGSNYTVRYRY